jgi:hypothetical protein
MQAGGRMLVTGVELLDDSLRIVPKRRRSAVLGRNMGYTGPIPRKPCPINTPA